MTLDKAVAFGVLVVVILAVPDVASRRRTTIVIARSMDMSAWIVLLQLIPLIDVIVTIWLVFAMPARHDRTRLWGVVLLVPLVNLVGFLCVRVHPFRATFDPGRVVSAATTSRRRPRRAATHAADGNARR